jgi:hypothetical protein
MIEETLTLEDLRERTLEEVLREVVARREVLTVRLPEGESVAIQPMPRLKPLPTLEGFVPEGWKDAIYG